MSTDGWGNIERVSVADDEITGPLTNFPVFIELPDKVFNELTDDSMWAKLNIVDSLGNDLDCESVIFDTTSRKGLLASAMDFSDVVHNEFFLCFDALHADNPKIVALGNASATVWQNNYKSVWPLVGDPGGTSPQGTDVAGNRDLWALGTMTSGDLIDVAIGRAWDFDGSNDYALANTTALGITTTGTWTVMIKPGGSLPGGRIMGKSLASPNLGFELVYDLANKAVEWGGSPDGTAANWLWQRSAVNSVLTDVLTPIQFVMEASQIHLYINGTYATSGGFPFAYSGGVYDGGQSLLIAGNQQNNDTFGGAIQFASISDVARNAAWNKAEAASLLGTLFTFMGSPQMSTGFGVCSGFSEASMLSVSAGFISDNNGFGVNANLVEGSHLQVNARLSDSTGMGVVSDMPAGAHTGIGVSSRLLEGTPGSTGMGVCANIIDNQSLGLSVLCDMPAGAHTGMGVSSRLLAGTPGSTGMGVCARIGTESTGIGVVAGFTTPQSTGMGVCTDILGDGVSTGMGVCARISDEDEKRSTGMGVCANILDEGVAIIQPNDTEWVIPAGFDVHFAGTWEIFLDGKDIRSFVPSLNISQNETDHDQISVRIVDHKNELGKIDPMEKRTDSRLEFKVGDRSQFFLLENVSGDDLGLSVTGRALSARDDMSFTPEVFVDTSEPKMAQQYCKDVLIYNDIDWQVPDWMLPADIDLTGKPFAVVSNITSRIKAVIRNNDGSGITVRRLHQVRPIDNDTVPADLEYPPNTILPHPSFDFTEGPGYNSVQIIGSAGRVEMPDMEVEDMPEGQTRFIGTDSYIRVYWAEGNIPDIVETFVTSGSAKDLGSSTSEHKEQLTFNDNSTSTSKPVTSGLTWNWIGKSAGGVSFSKYSKTLVSDERYGIADVEYKTTYQRLLLYGHAVPILLAALDVGAGQGSSLFVNIDPGDNPAPAITDDLLTTDEIMLERGTAFLDANKYNLGTYRATAPYHPLAKPGNRAYIDDAKVGRAGNFKIVSMRTVAEGPKVLQQLELSQCKI